MRCHPQTGRFSERAPQGSASEGAGDCAEPLAQPLLDAVVLDFVPFEMVQPERHGPAGDRVGGGLNLAGTFFALDPLIREGRNDRARLGVGVRIIDIIVLVAADKQNGLLDHALTYDLRKKINARLGTPGTSSDV